MEWLNLVSCLAAVLTIWPTSHVSAAVKLTHLSSVYLPYNVTSAGPQYNLSSDAVEQISYDAKEKIVYAGGYEVIHVIDVGNANKLELLYSKFVPGLDLTDVEVCGDYVFVSADNDINRLDGQLLVYKTHKKQGNTTMQLLKSVPVGPGPDNIYPRAGCKSVIVALEAEAFFDDAGKFVDPEGAVTIVSWPNGVEGTEQTLKKMDFKAFNSKVTELLPTGVRFVYRENNNTFSADVEPEYIALDPEANKAYVCLQENNAVAVVDLSTETVTQIHGLGYKQWGVLDASDRDLGIQLSYWPIRAWYQPDAIQFVSWKGRKLVVSANEGDLKKYSNFREYLRGKQFTGLGDQIPDVMKTWLQEDSQLGKLKMSKLDGKDEKGLYQALYTYGARSFSIWDAADGFRRIYDSGSDIEKHTAFQCPYAFNTEGDDIDAKSDSKGPETESLAVGQIGDRMFFFVGNENPGTILVYSVGDDVTQPRFETIFCDGLPDNKKTLQEKFDAREIFALDPEDIKFVTGPESPTGSPVLIVAGSVSGTVSVLKIEVS
ncbi:hypothetical protein BsWGS_15965 [Bradybaena similaris]